jgi:hypothetical protein
MYGFPSLIGASPAPTRINQNPNTTFSSEWGKAVDKLPFADREIIAALKNIGYSIGSTDTDGQVSLFNSSTEVFTEMREKAIAENEKISPLWTKGGLLVGLLAAIVII